VTDHPSKLSLISILSPPAAKDLDSEQFQAILRSHKREGLALAFWARTVALIFISAFLFFIVQWPVVLFPQLFLAAFFVVGWLQQRYGRVGRSRIELLLAFADIALLTAVVVIPNPLNPDDLPLPLQYHFDSFIYAFVMLAGVTLSLHWRTINLLGFGVPLIWLAAAAAVWFFFQPLPHLTALADQMFGTRTDLNDLFDPNEINWDQRVQEALVYCLVALILGLNGMRGERLLLQFAEAERKRTNLSRYFSPNVTAELVRADDALSQSRTIPVAVMFVDIVGFTRFASGVSAAEAMETLRSFFARMERAVFAHHGTLDKYLGDGLMATFGTPVPGPDSAVNALRCGAAMQSAVEDWNRERAQRGLPPFRIGVGVHFGEVAFGNIGNSRLELAVIGDTVNVASRLESLTRELDATIAVSREVLEQAIAVAGPQDPCLAGFHPVGPRKVQGTSKWIEVAAISRPPMLPPAAGT
jgi:adenylate cyclase